MLVTGTLAEKGFHVFDTEPRLHTENEIPRIFFVVASDKQAYIYRSAANATLVMIAHMQDKGEKHGKSSPPEAAFIYKLANWLNLAAKEEAFDQLVLVAAPETLGNMRAGLSKDVQGSICAEIDKELTGMSIPELQERLSFINGST